MVEPEFGLNVGYVARTMANFGLSRLVIVSSRRLENDRVIEARKFASHGGNIVDKIEYIKSMKALRGKFKLLVGTTAITGTRKANLTRKTLDAEVCASRLCGRISQKPHLTCIVLGRDTTGMTNEELRYCDYNMTIRASYDYNTLNVSHAFAIIMYVFSKTLTKKSSRYERKTASSRREREQAISLFEQLAELSEFQKFKAGLLRETLSRLFDRADPSLRETYLLMGLAGKALSKIKRTPMSPP